MTRSRCVYCGAWIEAYLSPTVIICEPTAHGDVQKLEYHLRGRTPEEVLQQRRQRWLDRSPELVGETLPRILQQSSTWVFPCGCSSSD